MTKDFFRVVLCTIFFIATVYFLDVALKKEKHFRDCVVYSSYTDSGMAGESYLHETCKSK